MLDQACILITLVIVNTSAYEPSIFLRAQSYAHFKNQSSCWVCSQLRMFSTARLPWWISSLQGSNWMALKNFILEETPVPCKY